MKTNRISKDYNINSVPASVNACVSVNAWGIFMPVLKTLNPASEVKA